MLTTIVAVLILPLLLLVKGFFSGSEIALVNADRLHLQHLASGGHRGARLTLKLLKRPELLLSTTLIGTNIATVMLVTIGTGLAIGLAGSSGDMWAIAVLTPLLLVLGEVVPKSIYQQKANVLAPIVIFPLWSLSLLLAPLTYAFSGVARLVARMTGVGDAPPAVLITKNMIRTVGRMADRAAGIESFDRGRIEHATGFDGRLVGELLIPLGEVPRARPSATLGDLVSIIAERGVYRVPLFDDEKAEVVGTVAVDPWQLLAGIDLDEPARESMAPPLLFATERQRVGALVPVLQARADRMAIVVDDRGQVLGVVTLEDILAGVYGRMDPGFRTAPQTDASLVEVIVETDSLAELGGRVSTSQLAEALDAELPSTPAYTVGGLVNQLLGRLGRVGDRVVFDEFEILVLDASETEVRRVRVQRVKASR